MVQKKRHTSCTRDAQKEMKRVGAQDRWARGKDDIARPSLLMSFYHLLHHPPVGTQRIKDTILPIIVTVGIIEKETKRRRTRPEWATSSTKTPDSTIQLSLLFCRGRLNVLLGFCIGRSLLRTYIIFTPMAIASKATFD